MQPVNKPLTKKGSKRILYVKLMLLYHFPFHLWVWKTIYFNILIFCLNVCLLLTKQWNSKGYIYNFFLSVNNVIFCVFSITDTRPVMKSLSVTAHLYILYFFQLQKIVFSNINYLHQWNILWKILIINNYKMYMENI